jgi:predicted outer membrane lipoprotein
MKKRLKIPLTEAILMLSKYAWTRIKEQIKSVAFIILYLVGFQLLILNVPLANALVTVGGIVLVVFGLAFFLEGLFLGLMPLGERVGIKMPQRVNISVIAIFGLILGFGATLAEPAISALRTAGSSITAWDAPLLYMILEPYADWLIISVGIGVGIAVALGMFRFYYNWSIKPFIYVIIPLLLIFSVYAYYNENLNTIIGLAWDCGAVTTGAVTVPLVLALGIGVSSSSNKGQKSSGGFGIILLASAFPILAVLTLSFILEMKVPDPVDEKIFFSIENRENALKIFENEDKLAKHAFTHANEEGRRAYFESEELYVQELLSLKDDLNKQKLLMGDISLNNWLLNHASKNERSLLTDLDSTSDKVVKSSSFNMVLKEESFAGVRAVVPLSILLLVVLIVLLRERIRYKDEVALGIVFSLIGMILLTSGIRLGLASLGSSVGGELPRAFAKEEKFVDRILIKNFDTSVLFNGIAPDGTTKKFFNLIEDHNDVSRIEFKEHRYDEEEKVYEHIITQEPLFGQKLTVLGLILVLIFVFGMGFGATLAEPALRALGLTVENLTVGTIKQKQIVKIVSIGVGLGITLGFARILFNIPLVWLIVPPYILLIILSVFSEEEYTAMAWDSGGVTTGPVTVPLVLAMGLSIGGALNIADGFGVLALASAFPIITTLTYGMYKNIKQKRSIETNSNDNSNE